MKKIGFLFIFIFIFSFLAKAQFKSEIEKKDNIFEPIEGSQSNLILGLFNPENFSMKHSYSFIYSNFGVSGMGMGIGIYTNSMKYKFSDNLNAKIDISLAHSPFGSSNKSLVNKFSGLYINRAEVNYKPFDNFLIQVKYRQLPAYSYSPYMYFNYGLGYDPFYDYDDPFRR
jgi:hypothetical protein